jgi:hypothetical protein
MSKDEVRGKMGEVSDNKVQQIPFDSGTFPRALKHPDALPLICQSWVTVVKITACEGNQRLRPDRPTKLESQNFVLVSDLKSAILIL